MDRRLFIASTLGAPLLACTRSDGAEGKDSSKKSIHVPAGQDGTKGTLRLGRDRIDVKVSTKDSDGGLYLFEGIKIGKGGPIRHVHLEQDEWFPTVDGCVCGGVGLDGGLPALLTQPHHSMQRTRGSRPARKQSEHHWRLCLATDAGR